MESNKRAAIFLTRMRFRINAATVIAFALTIRMRGQPRFISRKLGLTVNLAKCCFVELTGGLSARLSLAKPHDIAARKMVVAGTWLVAELNFCCV